MPVTTGTIVAVVIGVLVAPGVARRGSGRPSRRCGAHRPRSPAASPSRRRSVCPIDELLRRAAEAMRTGLDSPRVEIWLTSPTVGLTRSVTLGVTDDAPALHRRATARSSRGSASPVRAGRSDGCRSWSASGDPHDARRAPLRVGAITDSGELLGMVVVGRRAGAPRYDFEDDDSLAAACRLLAAIVRNRQLTYALEESLADLQVTNDAVAAFAHSHRHGRRRGTSAHRTQPARRRAAAPARARRDGRAGAPDGRGGRTRRRDRGDARATRRRRERRDRAGPRTRAGHLSGVAHGRRPRTGAAGRGRSRADDRPHRCCRRRPLPAEPRSRGVLLRTRSVAERGQARAAVDRQW